MRRIYAFLLPVLLLTLFAADVGSQNIVAKYEFSGNAKDVSPYANTASIYGATLTQDRFGRSNQAFLFDGVQSYLVAPNASQLQSPMLSVSFWVRPDAIPPSGEVYLLSHGGWQERWKISLPSHAKPIWTTHAATCCSDLDVGGGNELVVGDWVHLVMVHDGTKDKIYLNGNLVNEKDAPGDLAVTGAPFGMGYSPIDGDYFFNGALDEVTLFDGALSATQVANLYAAESQAPVVVDELVAQYSFNGNFKDDSPYRNHAIGKNVDFVPDRFGFGDKAAALRKDDLAVNNGTITAPNSSHLNSPTTTVSFWVNPVALPASGESYLVSFGGWQERWKLSLPSHGKVVWTTHATSCCSDLDAGGGNELVPGTWTHVVAVHDGVKDKIFINGVLANEKDAPGDLNSTTHPLGIGYDPIDVANYFNGSIDEVLIYNFALTDSEIGDLYAEQATAIIDPDPLVLNIPFAGDFKDVSQFANHGKSHDAELTYDRFGYANNAVAVNGTTPSTVTVDNSPAYNSDYQTVSLWVKMNELPVSGEVYLASFGGWQERWKLSVPSHGKVVWTTHATSCCSDMDAGNGNELVPGVWTHVVAVHGPVQDKIYINGALVASKDVGGPLHDTQYPVGIGFNPIDNDNYMNGDIDEFRIYNNALTDAEVAALYTAQNTEPVFPGDIVADYPLDASGVDVSPYHNNADVLGAVAAIDRFGRSNHAMNFDGDDGLRADNSPQLNSPVTSVSFWVNPNSLPPSGEVYLLSFGGWQERWKISLPTHGKAVWTTHATSCCSDLDAGAGNELVPGTWTHMVMVHDGTKDYIYVNGVLANEKDAPGALNTTTHPLGIGYDPIDVANYFDGRLDDVLIFETALSAAEVAALYADQSADPGESDITAPDAPVGLEATVEFTTVTLNWQPSDDSESGLAGYNVYQDGLLVQTVTEPTAVMEGLAALTSYEFGVSAVDSAGNESAATFLTVTTGMDETPDITPPSTPTNLAVSAGANSAVFSWDPSTDDTAVRGYVVFVDGNFIDSLDADQTSIFIGGLDPSTLYTFEVYAFDFAGNDSEVAFITVSTSEPVVTAEPGLVAHYPFEGNANDATPYNNHGAIGGDPTFEPVTNRPDASGLSIVFDGDQDSVLAPNAVQLISDFATVSFWIRVDAINLDDPEAYIIDFGHWDERWKISLPSLHRQIVWTTNSMTVQFDELISDMDSGAGNDLVLGFWWHVTMVHDGTDDIIYLDGVEVARKPAPGTLNSTGRPLGMGNNPIDGGHYFHGALDEVKIYSKALTADEIERLYTTGTTGIGDIPNEVYNYVEVLYPNPTLNDLAIKHGFTTSEELVIRIFDIQGRQVGGQKVNAADFAGELINMNVAGILPGTYNLNFVLGGKNLGSIPFVKQ